MRNTLLTEDQKSVEALALRLVERADIRAAREKARGMLLADPAAKSFSARMGLDRALDLWMMALAMREANGDPLHPKAVWSVDNAPRQWFGHIYPGAAVAVDNPDNVNREMPIHGDSAYELDIEFSANPTSLSLVMEIEPEHHAGIGENLATLGSSELAPSPGKRITVTVDSADANGRPYHMKSRPGARIQLYARDSHSDWAQKPGTINIRRVDTAKKIERTEEEIASAIAIAAPAFVRFWLGFKDTFLGFPEPNRIVGPHGRIGGWGLLAGGRFRLAEGEGLLVRVRPSGAAYTGFQVTDPFTIAPDPVYRQSSLNRAQATADLDGCVCYVVAATDPGILNWIDTVGLTEGWMLLRWQGVPPDADPSTFVKEVRLVRLDDLPSDVQLATLQQRATALALRAHLHHTRTLPGLQA